MDKNQKEIRFVVMTGGPCAGKTTAVNALKTMYEGEGYTVLCVPEVASLLIGMGLIPMANGKGNIPGDVFQEDLYQVQSFLEKLVRKRAEETIENDRIAIIFDRGLLDNRAYTTFETFQTFIDKDNLTIDDIIDMYHVIYHLVSIACDKPDAYCNNQTRFESLKKAVEVEMNTRRAWGDILKKIMIGNRGTLEDKIEDIANLELKEIQENSKTVILRDPDLLRLVNDAEVQWIKVEDHIEDSKSYILYRDQHSYKLTVDNTGIVSLSMGKNTEVPEWIGSYYEPEEERKLVYLGQKKTRDDYIKQARKAA